MITCCEVLLDVVELGRPKDEPIAAAAVERTVVPHPPHTRLGHRNGRCVASAAHDIQGFKHLTLEVPGTNQTHVLGSNSVSVCTTWRAFDTSPLNNLVHTRMANTE